MSKLAKVFDVSECKSVLDVLAHSHTDWEPLKVNPTYARDNYGTEDAIDSDYMAIVNPKTQRALAFVKGRYKTQSHVSQVMNLEKLVINGDIKPNNVSVWDGGSMIAYQFSVPSLASVIHDKDTVSPLLTLAFFHDGKGADMTFFSDFRWSCKNQLGRVALVNDGFDRARHTAGNRVKFEDMLMGRISALGSELSGRYLDMSAMTARKLTGKNLLTYFARSIGAKDDHAEVVDSIYRNPKEVKGKASIVKDIVMAYREDDCGAPSSVWHAFNGVTRYVTHYQGRWEGTRRAKALLGTGDKILSDAFVLAKEAS